MSDQNLPEGAFLTTLNGRQCTAVPRSDAAATSTAVASSAAASSTAAATSADAAATSADAAASPPVAAGGENGGDSAATADVGVQADTGAAASTANSSPGVESASDAASTSPAQSQNEDAIQQTALQAAQASPSDLPSPSSPTQASTQAEQDPSPSSSAEPPESSQTPEQSQPATENSPTDNSAAPTTPPVNVNNAGDQPQEPVPTPVPPQNNPAPDTSGLDGASAEGTQEIANSSGGNTPSTAVLAGSIAGGVALVSAIAFLLWFWRKRAINKRRSSLLTPLTIPPGAGKGGGGAAEKGAYVIDRESLGPTLMGQRLRAAVGFPSRRSGGGPQNVARDDASSMASREVVTGRDRFRDWWERLTADVNFNWKLRNDGASDQDPAAAAREVRERGAGRNSSQPDFLTLLGMDDKEVQREAARRQAGHKKRPSNASEHFLGGLGLNFNSSGGSKENPFSDINALSHNSAKPAPLSVSPSRTANPFSDENAVRGPATYVADVRRSRGNPGGKEPYRESVASVEPRRTKFRSDPFDLERPELLGSMQDLTMTSSGDDVGRPRRAHTREDSYSSKYSSGFSLGDWSDPGPDVGPGGARPDVGKKGSNRSVGTAL